MFKTIPRYEETSLGLPYPITLINGAQELIDDETGQRVGVKVPDLEGLAAAVALVRCLDPLEFSGEEVRFVRKVLGYTQKELAERLELAASGESISRWESGQQGVVGGYVEKLLRSLAVINLDGRAPGVSAKPQHIVNLKIKRRTEKDIWPQMEAERVRVKCDGASTIEWDLAA